MRMLGGNGADKKAGKEILSNYLKFFGGIAQIGLAGLIMGFFFLSPQSTAAQDKSHAVLGQTALNQDPPSEANTQYSDKFSNTAIGDWLDGHVCTGDSPLPHSSG